MVDTSSRKIAGDAHTGNLLCQSNPEPQKVPEILSKGIEGHGVHCILEGNELNGLSRQEEQRSEGQNMTERSKCEAEGLAERQGRSSSPLAQKLCNSYSINVEAPMHVPSQNKVLPEYPSALHNANTSPPH